MGWADTGAVAAGGLAGALPEADTAAAALLTQAGSPAGRRGSTCSRRGSPT